MCMGAQPRGAIALELFVLGFKLSNVRPFHPKSEWRRCSVLLGSFLCWGQSFASKLAAWRTDSMH